MNLNKRMISLNPDKKILLYLKIYKSFRRLLTYRLVYAYNVRNIVFASKCRMAANVGMSTTATIL